MDRLPGTQKVLSKDVGVFIEQPLRGPCGSLGPIAGGLLGAGRGRPPEGEEEKEPFLGHV